MVGTRLRVRAKRQAPAVRPASGVSGSNPLPLSFRFSRVSHVLPAVVRLDRVGGAAGAPSPNREQNLVGDTGAR